jgi:hypothetical protein
MTHTLLHMRQVLAAWCGAQLLCVGAAHGAVLSHSLGAASTYSMLEAVLCRLRPVVDDAWLLCTPIPVGGAGHLKMHTEYTGRARLCTCIVGVSGGSVLAILLHESI